MLAFRIYIICVVSIFALGLSAQISPGPLSEAHKELEGLSNCTKCHDLGNKVPDRKCLDCHEVIDRLINTNQGYHSSSEVRSKECTDCHNEHHGRKFDMVRFDEESFNHDLTGYSLEGTHTIIDCRACHQSKNINDPELRKRNDTYLGLDDKCLTCHDDFHQQTLDNDCRKCHDMEAFRPATLFDHNEADFHLRGRHEEVGCAECHPIEMRNGIEFQKFKDIPFHDCIACHNDAHDKNLPGKCVQCHQESGWTSFIGQRRFNHELTAFTLYGAHKNVNCFECHQNTRNSNTIFQDQMNVSRNDCNTCHDDVHEGKFGLDCATCHMESNFFDLKNMDDFNHSLTNFSLEGLHINVDCNQCHSERLTDPLDFQFCFDCHEDYHNGEFVENNIPTDCISCHTVEEPFTYTLFGIDDHNSTQFPLTGSHLATPCFECHLSEEQWSFREIGITCIDCHDNIHEGYLDEPYILKNDCTACHSTNTWVDVNFDHSTTDYMLTGMHLNARCSACHFNEEIDGQITQVFKDLSTECASCHQNPHGDQFKKDGITDCNRCHNTEGWDSEYFDHSKTRFPLDGEHAKLDCSACHPNELQADGIERVLYRIEKLNCIDCHS